MTNRIPYTTVPLLISISFYSLSQCFSEEAQNPPNNGATTFLTISGEERIEALQLLTKQLKSNFDEFKSWKGSYTFIDMFRLSGKLPEHPSGFLTEHEISTLGLPPINRTLLGEENTSGSEGYWEITQGVADFSLNNQKGEYHVFYDPIETVAFINLKDGKEFRWKSSGDSIHWIITSERFVEFDTQYTQGQLRDFEPVPTVPQTGGRIAIVRSADSVSRNVRTFDPRDLFSAEGTTFWETCQMYSSALKGDEGDKKRLKIEEKCILRKTAGSPPDFELEMLSGKDSWVKIEFNSKDGFSPINYEHYHRGKKLYTSKFSYSHKGNRYIPSHVLITRYDISESSETPKSIRQLDLLDTNENIEISESEFSIASLGLTYGERVHDELHNTLLVVDKDQSLVEASAFIKNFSLPPSPSVDLSAKGADINQSSWFNNRWIISVNAVCLLVIITWLVRRRGSKTTVPQ